MKKHSPNDLPKCKHCKKRVQRCPNLAGLGRCHVFSCAGWRHIGSLSTHFCSPSDQPPRIMAEPDLLAAAISDAVGDA